MENTQNMIKSVNNKIWSIDLKNNFLQLKTLTIGVYDAVGLYNDSNIYSYNVLRNLGIELRAYCMEALVKLDKMNVRDAELCSK